MKHLTMIITVGLLLIGGTGCLSTGGSAGGGVVAAPRTVADYSAEAHDIAYLAAGLYLASREKIDVDKREAVRQAYVAFDEICDGYLANQDKGGEVLAVGLIDAILDRAKHDPATRPLIRALVQRIVSRLDKAGVPFGSLNDADLWRVIIAVRNGIKDAIDDDITADPTKPVTE